MSVTYIEPLGRSWDRARRMLFRPFRLESWIVLGFAAFLSELGRSGRSWGWNMNFGRTSAGEVADSVHDFLHRPGVLMMIALIAAVALMVGVVLLWVGARGRFVFLDDVLHERAGIVAPWKRHARLGNSLFLLELLVGGVALAVFLLLFGRVLISVLRGIWKDGAFPAPDWGTVVIGVVVGVPLFILAAVFNVMTHHFVVPTMWKHDLGAFAAWARFWPLLAGNPGGFVVYLLLLLGLVIALGITVIVLGACTCCVGFLLLAIPYVGSVLLLPAHVTFRSFGPEFLSQFGPEWDLRPRRGESAEPPPVPPLPPQGAPA